MRSATISAWWASSVRNWLAGLRVHRVRVKLAGPLREIGHRGHDGLAPGLVDLRRLARHQVVQLVAEQDGVGSVSLMVFR